MPDQNTQSASDEIVSRGREERAAMRAKGLKMDSMDEAPHLDLMQKTRQESHADYVKRVKQHKIKSNLIDAGE
ncbi:MAG: hypothetical protein ACOYUZ_04500 [Patescibacteria group bacterium]